MTKFVISGYIGFDNFGDELIASTLIKHLQEKKDNSVTVISGKPQKTSKLYNCSSVGMLNFFMPIIKSDILISGGGSLLQDITSLKSLVYYLTVIITALIFRKKVFIFAQGMTPFRTKFGELLTKFVLKKCHKITLRDKKSKLITDNWEISSDIIPDVAWGITPNNTTKSGLGIQLRENENLSDDFLKTLAKNVVMNFQNAKITLISLQDTMDLAILEKFKTYLQEYKTDIEIKQNLTVKDAIYEISQLEFLIGMRFHACLVASKANVKILGLNYDIKVKTLSEEVNFPCINLLTDEISQGIKNLQNADTTKYNIPSFTFPNFNI